jgi:hypothetical protein
MCGRYVRRSDKQKIAEHFAVHGPSRFSRNAAHKRSARQSFLSIGVNMLAVFGWCQLINRYVSEA